MRRYLKLLSATASLSALAWAGSVYAQDRADANPQTSPAPVTTTAKPQQNSSAPNATTTPGGTGPVTPESANVAEVVVTATKRTERVQDVPIPVTVVGGEQLARQNIYSLNDLAAAVPSLQPSSGQGTLSSGPAIRGISTLANSLTSENAVGVVVDGVVFGREPLNSLFDISRVEVLRGPQGTLFGKNASAGVINITTNAPNPNEFEAILHADQGFRFDYGVYQAVLNIPLTSNAALRISGHVNNEEGLIDNVVHDKSSENIDEGLRAKFLWTPTDRLTINMIADIDNSRVNNEFQQLDTLDPSAMPGAALIASCGVTPSHDNRDSCSSGSDFIHNTTYGVSNQIDYRLGDFTLTSITAERQTSEDSNLDIDGLPIDVLDHSNGPEYTQTVTQEFRVASPARSRLEYVGGIFYSDTDVKELNVDQGTVPLVAFGPVVIVPPLDTASQSHANLESIAAFGQGTFHITDKLRAILGLRETYDDLKENSQDLIAFTSTNAATNRANFSYRVGGQYDVSRDLMGYFTFARGYKGPQVNLPQLGIPASLVEPEIPIAYELGVKGSILDRRLAVDVNLFSTTIHDFQNTVLEQSPEGASTFVIGNVGKVYTRGVEVDVFGRPLPGLNINGGFIYNDASYGHYLVQCSPNPASACTDAAANLTDVDHKQLELAPRYKFILSGEYDHSLTSVFDGFVQSDFVFTSKLNNEVTPDPLTTIPDQYVLGGRVGVKTHDGKYSLALFVRNALNNNYAGGSYDTFYGLPSVGTGTTTFHSLSVNNFRLVGITLDGRF